MTIKKKLITAEKNYRFRFYVLIVLVFFFISLVQNFMTRFVSDDWCYLFIYDHMGNPNENTRRVKNIIDAIVSMKNHWKICNGRVVAHGLLQMVLSTSWPRFHKIVFNILNSAIYVYLGIIIYIHASYKRRHSLFLFLCIYVMFWFFLPQYGATVLWASGAANYLWCTAITLSYLLPYRMYADGGDQSVRNTTKNMIIAGVIGLFAGCTNENSGGSLAFMCILYIIYYKITDKPIPKWSLTGVAGVIIGAAIMIAAPGNYRISSKADWNEFILRLQDVMVKSEQILFGLLIILCVVLFLVCITNKRSPSIYASVICFFGAIASIGVLVFPAMRPERTWFIGVCLIITTIANMFTNIDIEKLPSKLLPICAVVIVVITSASYATEMKKMNYTYAQTKRQYTAISEALKNNINDVHINALMASDSKYDAASYVIDFEQSADTWQNAWAARYYGFDRLYADNN